ncbi:MAG: calcium/sodium antiporter [Rikenellaceae bacterium]
MESQFLQILILVVGLILILGGANYLTDGSAAIARRFNVSGFVIGMTIVALGTSMPEMVVSVVSALKGSSDIAVGNVVGSNNFNTLIILGICSVVRPITLTQRNVFRDIPMCVGASVLLLILSLNGVLSRVDGVVMLLIYIGMILYSVRNARPSVEEQSVDEAINTDGLPAVWLSVVMIVGGLGALIYGGTIFIDSAVAIAQMNNIPENIIAITLVAGGTSLPEFAASLVSLIKGKSDLALGNVIGSNIANILLVLGAGATLTPLTLGGITLVDMGVVLGGAVFLFISAFTLGRNQLDRAEGAVMVVAFVGYICYAVQSSF